MSEPATESASPLYSPVVSDLTLGRLRRFGSGLCACAVLLLVVMLWSAHQSSTQVESALNQIAAVRADIQTELAQLDRVPPEFPKPNALKSLLKLGQSVNENNKGIVWFGQLFAQKEQYLVAQAIETLSEPVGGVNLDDDMRRSRESALRLNTLQKLDSLQTLLLEASNGYLIMLGVLASLLGTGGLAMVMQWFVSNRTNQMAKRVNALGKALHTQEKADQLRQGASQALQGVQAILEQTHNVEHRQTLIQLGEHLETLKNSGHSVLQFAHAFHQMSAQATQVAKTALTNEQRNTKADTHLEAVRKQLEGLREDVRSAAQGLRKAGEASRQLLVGLDPNQLSLELNESEQSEYLQNLVEQGQQALKEAIEGLVLASQKINTGSLEHTRLAEFMAVNQTAWSNLLEQVEQYADSASAESAKALILAKGLIQHTKTIPGAVQAASAPPQLLP